MSNLFHFSSFLPPPTSSPCSRHVLRPRTPAAAPALLLHRRIPRPRIRRTRHRLVGRFVVLFPRYADHLCVRLDTAIHTTRSDGDPHAGAQKIGPQPTSTAPAAVSRPPPPRKAQEARRRTRPPPPLAHNLFYISLARRAQGRRTQYGPRAGPSPRRRRRSCAVRASLHALPPPRGPVRARAARRTRSLPLPRPLLITHHALGHDHRVLRLAPQLRLLALPRVPQLQLHVLGGARVRSHPALADRVHLLLLLRGLLLLLLARRPGRNGGRAPLERRHLRLGPRARCLPSARVR
ncbi:hypothetical protein C8R46DRAFT_1121512 [Mycena filopes]|nr:hypothetical protein C8R46DRAFT_1121512 [Mycena filopes]